jgi:RNA polymerase primary sigma factor
MQSTPLSIDPTAALRVKYALWEHGSDVDAAWASFRDAEDPTKRMSRETFIAMVEALAEAGSLDAPVRAVEKGSAPQDGGDYGLSLADVIPDPSSEISGAVERRDLARWLMTQIPQRQAFALRAYYGVGMTKQTEQETCADMGVKPSNLRGLRSAGTKSARRVADVHGIAA